EVTGLIVGLWNTDIGSQDAASIIEAVVAARDRLPQITALFFGDIIMEECEISWIEQGDVSPLFQAYPALEHFGVRGGNGLSLGSPRHDHLKSLMVQAGGLNASVVRSITAAHLPALEHLELWLGDAGYGATVTLSDLQP